MSDTNWNGKWPGMGVGASPSTPSVASVGQTARVFQNGDVVNVPMFGWFDPWVIVSAEWNDVSSEWIYVIRNSATTGKRAGQTVQGANEQFLVPSSQAQGSSATAALFSRGDIVFVDGDTTFAWQVQSGPFNSDTAANLYNLVAPNRDRSTSVEERVENIAQSRITPANVLTPGLITALPPGVPPSTPPQVPSIKAAAPLLIMVGLGVAAFVLVKRHVL